MRHGKKINHLGRKSAHRRAMLANMASSLILNKRVQTTTAKAKALRTYIEPLITKAKDDRTHSRRVVFRYLQNKEAVSELFREVAEKVSDRPGGYTRILKTGTRLGDNAEMCFIELVDYNENYISSAEAKSKTSKRRRRRGGGSKKKTEETSEQATAESTTGEETKTDNTKLEESKEEKKETQSQASKEQEVKEEKQEETKVQETEDKEEKSEKKEAKEEKKEKPSKAQKETGKKDSKAENKKKEDQEEDKKDESDK